MPESGRGLLIVAAMSRAWGTRMGRVDRLVWAELSPHPLRRGAPMLPDPRHDVHAAEIERAVRDLQDALSRLEALGQAPYPVGDPTGCAPSPAIGGWGEMGVLLPGEALIWSPPSADAHEPGLWVRWPHAWTPPEHRP